MFVTNGVVNRAESIQVANAIQQLQDKITELQSKIEDCCSDDENNENGGRSTVRVRTHNYPRQMVDIAKIARNARNSTRQQKIQNSVQYGISVYNQGVNPTIHTLKRLGVNNTLVSEVVRVLRAQGYTFT